MHARGQIGRLLGAMHRYTRLHFTEALEAVGLPEQTLICYMALLEQDGIRQEQLTDRCHKDAVSTSRALARLEDLGLVVRRVPEDDKRAKTVHLTPRARKLAPKVRAVLGTWMETVTAGLTEDQVAALIDTLSHMVDNAAHALHDTPHRHTDTAPSR